MSTKETVLDAFRGMLGASGTDVQAAYGMTGDWCAMTVYIGFRNAGALDDLAGGLKTAWVPTLWDYYDDRGLTGATPEPGALVMYDFNANGTADHIEYVESVEGNNAFTTIAGNTGACVAVQRVNRTLDGVLGFAYPEYSDDSEQAAAAAEPDYSQEMKMTFIYRPNEADYLAYYDGNAVHRLSHPDEVIALNMCYNACFGRDIPMFELGTSAAPWATRFEEAATRAA